ncbi:MAG: Asp23/Gls24 family envelope stress response protein [Oscillospiraceae bacterium]|nr:Asp23/Gls24 family envelope stress response protein [Oscillospiraceae bacterium]
MAENKQYITQTHENGNVMISEEVVSTIVIHAIEEVEGVAPVPVRNDLLNKRKLVKIAIAENNDLSIDVTIFVKFGNSVVEVAKAVQQNIIDAVESVTGVKVVVVNVSVSGSAKQ